MSVLLHIATLQTSRPGLHQPAMPLRVSVAVGSKKGDKPPVEIDLPSRDATVKALKEAFYRKVTKLHPTRQSFKFELPKEADPKTGKPPRVVRLDEEDKALAAYGYKEGMVLQFKDLGPQIGYRTVFVIEYLGPILIMLAYASRPALLYGPSAAKAFWAEEARLGVACWIAHFVKRELETFFVHKFSRPTMRLQQLFINCAYYYAFATGIGFFLAAPSYTPPASPLAVKTGLVIFGLCELGNLVCHIMLSRLRPADGAKLRPIPSGFLFELVACPNYFFEVSSWVGFSLLTGVPISWAFTLVGGLQMLDWAKGKHRGYMKTYGDEYKKLKRKAMVPFLI